MEKLKLFLQFIPIELLDIIKEFAFFYSGKNFTNNLLQFAQNNLFLTKQCEYKTPIIFLVRNAKDKTTVCEKCGDYLQLTFINKLPYCCDITIISEREYETHKRCTKPFTIISMLPRNFRKNSPHEILEQITQLFKKISCCCFIEK